MKKSKQERREEEARIIAEMDEAMQQLQSDQGEQAQPPAPQSVKRTRKARVGEGDMPAQLHCKRCKTLMENGVCPTCGFKVYIPMDDEKRGKVKLIATAVCMAIFLVVFVILQFVK